MGELFSKVLTFLTSGTSPLKGPFGSKSEIFDPVPNVSARLRAHQFLGSTTLPEVDSTYSRWWQLKYIFFTPNWGRFPFWLYNIFQMGWFNHQPVFFWCLVMSQMTSQKWAILPYYQEMTSKWWETALGVEDLASNSQNVESFFHSPQFWRERLLPQSHMFFFQPLRKAVNRVLELNEGQLFSASENLRGVASVVWKGRFLSWFCWWKKSCTSWYRWFSLLFPWFYTVHPRWCGISSISSGTKYWLCLWILGPRHPKPLPRRSLGYVLGVKWFSQ